MKTLLTKLYGNEQIRYLFAGGCTTLVNIVSFFLLRTFTEIDRNICNVIAIIFAIIFAYIINKYFVFRMHVDSVSALFVECTSFVGARILSMVVEVLGFSLLCDSFRLNEVFSKIAVQFVVVVMNYVFSKVFVFTGAKRDFRKTLERNWSWMLAALICFVFMLFVMILGDVAPFGKNTFNMVDSIHQYLPFFSDYQNKLKNEGSLFYTWNVGLGVNFQSLLLYYMASPINLLIVLVKRHSIQTVMAIIAALKIVASAAAFGYFLSRRGNRIKNNYFITVFAVAYALNNFIIGYFWNIMWMDCILMLPLVILGFERLMNGKGGKLYCLSLFYCLFCNYYIAFIICLFLILWFLASGHGTVKKFFTDGLKFAGFSLLSAGMAAFSLLTAYLGIMTTASAKADIPKWDWYGNIFAILKQHLILTQPIKNQTFDGGANLYCGMFTILLFVLYFFSERIKLAEKLRKLLLLALLVVSMNATTLNFIWHGFHDQYGIPNRFVFVYIFVLLLMAYEAVMRLRTINSAYVLSGMFFSLAFLFLLRHETTLGGKYPEWLVLSLSGGLFILYAVFIIVRNLIKKNYRLTAGILSLLFLTEILVSAAFGFRSVGAADGAYYLADVDRMKQSVETIADYAKEKDYTFYREDMVDSLMLDEATLNNMKSVGTFCSTVQGNVVTVMGRLGFYTGANEYLYLGATPLTDAILGVRFVYARDDDFYPEQEGHRVCLEENGITVYENQYVLPIAFGVENTILDWDIDDGRAEDCQNHFVEYAASGNPVFTHIPVDLTVTGVDGTAVVQEDNPQSIKYSASSDKRMKINAALTIPADGDYYLNCRGNGMEKLRFYVNGEQKAYDRYQMQLCRLGNLKAGDSVSIEINFSSSYSKNGTVSMYLSTFDMKNFLAAYELWDRNKMTVETFEDGYLAGSISLEKDMMMFTSIPYDKGWTVLVDGKKMDVEKIGDAFIGVPLTAGNHQIEMKYFPSGLKTGMLVSVISWVLFFVIINKKKSENVSNEQ